MCDARWDDLNGSIPRVQGMPLGFLLYPALVTPYVLCAPAPGRCDWSRIILGGRRAVMQHGEILQVRVSEEVFSQQ